jgi:hypothetical protein
MPRPIRLRHTGLDAHFIVDGDRVSADLDGDGRIAAGDRYEGPEVAALAAAARYFEAVYEMPYPGAPSQEPAIQSGGPLNAKEAAAFRQASGVPARRPDLLGHLDFFDRRSGDGVVSVVENYRSWRDLGFGVLKSVVQTIGSSIVFGRISDRFGIDIERIWARRPKGATGVYDARGNVDPGRLAEITAVFDRSDGLTLDEFRAALAARVPLGSVPRRQFESLYALTARANGSASITRAQVVGLFDNSLFWAIVSLPHRYGGRRL